MHGTVNTDPMVVASSETRRLYRSPPREARSPAMHQKGYRAATTLFARHGDAGTMVRLVAAMAKVSVPAVERLVDTKARLLESVTDVATLGVDEPVDTPFALIEPARFDRLIHNRGRTLAHYQHRVSRLLRCLPTSDADQRRCCQHGEEDLK